MTEAALDTTPAKKYLQSQDSSDSYDHIPHRRFKSAGSKGMIFKIIYFAFGLLK